MLSPNTVFRYLPASVLAVGTVALLVTGSVIARSWLSGHDKATELRATFAAEAKAYEHAQARQQQRDADSARTLSVIAAVKKAVRTPAQAAAEIPKLLTPLPGHEPIHIDVPAPEADVAVLPAIAYIPQDELKPIYDYLQDCRACQVQLATAKGNLEDERIKSSALTRERDEALRAIHAPL